MLETLLGGALAIAGGLFAGWFQMRNALRVRMEELTAERKVLMNGEALGRMKALEGRYQQSALRDTLEWIYEQEDWFFKNLLFFPQKFPEYWLSIRTNLRKLVRRERSPSADPVESERIDASVRESIERAISVIYEDAKVQPIGMSIVGPARQ